MLNLLSRKLKRWQKENLISEEQVHGIIAFERKRTEGKLVRDLTKVGLFAIFLGILSMVAANWQEIPPNMKIASHFILNAGLAGFILHVDAGKKPFVRDFCVVTLAGLFLTFIALIGQTYQLHGDLHTTILFWISICTPFMWAYGQTRVVANLWLLASLAALFMNLLYYIDHQDRQWALVIGSVIMFYLPGILLLIARSASLGRFRPGFVRAFQELGLYLPAIFTNLSIFMFYDNRVVEHQTLQLALMAFGLFATFILFHPGPEKPQEKTDLWYYLLLSGVIMMLPFAVPDLQSDLVAAGLFVGYWVFLAWIGVRIHSAVLVDIAIKLVILRLFIVYLEVFGSMMLTGFGLVISGVILLVILRYLNRIVAAAKRILNYEVL